MFVYCKYYKCVVINIIIKKRVCAVLTAHFTVCLVYQSISLEKSVGNDLF